MRQSYCSRCHALIYWGKTKNGKMIPLEQDGWAIPNPGGDVLWDDMGQQFRGVPTAGKIPGAVKIYRPHFIFCPYADRFRKPRKKTEWERVQDAKRAEEETRRQELAAKKAEKERVAAAQREFEEKQVSLF